MASDRLENYLRTYRKRSGLTQAEVAFFLGYRNGAFVSRHEQRRQLPSLEIALAYEAMFGVPVAELFAGLKQTIERDVAKRRRELRSRIDAKVVRGSAAQIKAHKLRWLANWENPQSLGANANAEI